MPTVPNLTEVETESEGEGGLSCGCLGALPPTCLWLTAGLPPVGGHRPPVGAPAAIRGGDWSHPASGSTGLGLQGRGPGGGDLRGRGPLPRPGWVGQRPPGPGGEARPSVAATINMFVQGKPGWELCALARQRRKGRLCRAHWGDCSRSRKGCPVAGKVRRPSAPSEAPGASGPCARSQLQGSSVHVALGPGAGREGARRPGKGGRKKQPGVRLPSQGRGGKLGKSSPAA